MRKSARQDGEKPAPDNHPANILQTIFSRWWTKSRDTRDEPERFELTSPSFLHARPGHPRVADEFADLGLPPWKKTRLRRKRDGRCVDCGGARPCHKHATKRAPKRTRESEKASRWILPGGAAVN